MHTDATPQKSTPSPGKRGSWRDAPLRLVGLLVIPATLGALLGLVGGGWFWWMDLFNHFWMHYAAGFLVASVLLVLLRSRWMLAISVLMLGLSLWQVWPMAWPTSVGGPYHEAPSDLRLLQFNVNTHGGDPAAVAAYLAEQDADIVFLQEVDRRWLEALLDNIGPYEQVIAEPRTDNFGIACYVRSGQDRVTVSAAEIVEFGNVPAIALSLSVVHFFGDDAPRLDVPVLSVHTLPPVNADYAQTRDEQLAAAGRWAREAGDHAVVIGDLNATPWSRPFNAMLEAGELHHHKGLGWQTTWPTSLPAPLGIPIDHCVHGRGWSTLQQRVGEPCGSDHRPLHVTLRQSGC